MFKFRPGTMDEYIYRQVVMHNEYQLPNSFDKKDIIIDIGAHIGSFSYACYIRGARQIYAFEADLANYACTQGNLTDCDSVEVVHAAVWRSDNPVATLHHTGHTKTQGVVNTGGGNVLWGEGGQNIEVPALALDDIIRTVASDGTIRLIKVDAETSEFPILLTSNRLKQVQEIVGEFHEVGGAYNDNYIPEHARIEGVDAFTVDVLEEYLTDHGFSFSYVRFPGSNMGYFKAQKLALKSKPKFY